MKLVKFLTTLIIFSLFFVAVSSYIVNKGLRRSKIEFNGKLNFASNSNEKIDLLLIGSSRVFRQLNPKIVDSITGLNSYNFGLNGATVKTCFNVTQFVLNKQLCAKVVLLNIDFYMFDIAIDLWKDPRFYPYESSSNKFIYDTSLTTKVFQKLKIFDVSFYDDNIKYIALDGIFRPNRKIDNWYKGFTPVSVTKFEEPMLNRKEKKSISYSERGFEILEELISMCKKKNVKLIFVSAPYRNDYFPTNYFNNYTPVMERVKKIAEKSDIPIFDFSSDTLSYRKDLFNDFNHLNETGSNIYSIMIAKKIRETKTCSSNTK